MADQNPSYWQNELQDWTKKAGLQQYLQSGLQDSTIGKSGFFDAATEQGKKFRERDLAATEQALGPAPTAGIDPAQAVQAGIAENMGAFQQRENMRQGGYAGALANQQSTTDWINQMMGSTSNMLNKNDEDWHNYRQSVMSVRGQNAAGQNATTGAYAGGGLALAGTIAAAVII